MKGAVFQLNTKGVQDKYLIGNPEINFIKQVYKRYVNFSIEPIVVTPIDPVNFGLKFNVKIKNIGDLLNKIYFCFRLPPLVKNSGTYAGWTNSIGNAIIESVSFEVNGISICKQYGLFMEIWSELTNLQTFSSVSDLMVGRYRHVNLLETNALLATEYSVPIPFWFCNSLGSSLPISAMYHQNITIVVKLKPFDECIVYDGNIPPDPVDIINGYILCDSIFLEENERKLVRTSPHRYIMSQVQYNEEASVSNSGTQHINLQFNHPVYEIIFVIREDLSGENNDWFNFSIRNGIVNTPIQEFITSAKLVTDNIDRTERPLTSHQLRVLNCTKYHTNSPDKHIYVMPFCEEPENPIQPTGFLNFSAISNTNLILEINGNVPSCKIHTFALNWNWIIIKDGFLSTSFNT